jgi:hypothetical protein
VIDSATPETYNDVFERLEHAGVRYVVIGGVAVVLHGHVRPVADLDIVISPVPEEHGRVLDALTEAGFVSGQPESLTTESELRMLDPAGRAVDIFAQYHVPFEDVWAGSERRSLGGSVVQVVSLEQLLRAKWATGRPHDVQDITALLEIKATGV